MKEKNFIDDLIKQSMEEMEYPFEPTDWMKMETRLDKTVTGYRRLIWLKTIEMGLVLLTIGTFLRFFADSPIQKKSTEEEGKIPAKIEKTIPKKVPDKPISTPLAENKVKELKAEMKELPIRYIENKNMLNSKKPYLLIKLRNM